MSGDTFDPSRERALVRGVLAEEETAIQEFAHRLRSVPRILAAENRRRGRPLDDHDLADLVQDTVVIILRKVHGFAGGSTPIEAWIYRVCRLEFMNGLRRKWRSRRPAPSETENPDESTAGTAESFATRDAIHTALAQLDADEAEVVRLKHFDTLTFPEMAERLGQSPNTCKTRYYRGLSRLEHLLREEEE